MKLRKEYLILLVVIVALALYLVLRDDDGSKGDLPQPAALDSARIERILISHEDQALELIKRDDQWTIEPQGYPADPVQVTNILNTISNLRLTALISESASYERYYLAEDQKIAVQAFAGNTLVREFDVGQVAPTIRHTFVKLAGNPNVYHAQGAFKNNFDHTADSLRDKTVLSFDMAGIDTIDIQKGDHAVTLTKKATTPEPPADREEGQAVAAPVNEWQNDQGRAVDQDQVERLMSAMAVLKCEAFLNERSPSEFQSPRWSVAFKNADQAYSLSVFAKSDEQDSLVPATTSTSPYVFTLPDSRIDAFEKQLDGLLGITVNHTEQ